MAKEDKLERAIIAGASAALKLKAKNPKMYDHEIIQELIKSIKEMKENID